MHALPLSAYFLFLELAAGGAVALFLVQLRGEVNRGFTLFTGWCLWIVAALAVWLRSAFPPNLDLLAQAGATWFAVERALSLVFVAALAAYLLLLQRNSARWMRPLGPLVPLLGTAALWAAALVEPGAQMAGLGGPLAVAAGGLALGTSVVGLSLGHWYLVTPTMSVQPLIRLTFLCLGALIAQVTLLPLLLFGTGISAAERELLFEQHWLFFAVRVTFGFVVPLITAVMVWRTARIRSLDSATGLLYVLATLILAGEIVARTLFFVTGVAT